jgi:peptidoglycan hydrolase CwlO-like protein
MKRTFTIAALLLLGLSQTAESAENQKTKEGKGTTVDDLTRGLKSAAQNVEKEIPKIGSAIEGTFKKVTEKSSGNKPGQETSKDKK